MWVKISEYEKQWINTKIDEVLENKIWDLMTRMNITDLNIFYSELSRIDADSSINDTYKGIDIKEIKAVLIDEAKRLWINFEEMIWDKYTVAEIAEVIKTANSWISWLIWKFKRSWVNNEKELYIHLITTNSWDLIDVMHLWHIFNILSIEYKKISWQKVKPTVNLIYTIKYLSALLSEKL